MRLWHYEIIPYLPKSQLLAQWRELCSIFRKSDKHILINYVYDYEPFELMSYAELVIAEMKKRGIHVNTELGSPYQTWLFSAFGPATNVSLNTKPFQRHHTDRYLLQCFYNLQEKYDRGQKDFSDELYERLAQFMCSSSCYIKEED